MYDRQAVKPVSLIHSINLVPRYIFQELVKRFCSECQNNVCKTICNINSIT